MKKLSLLPAFLILMLVPIPSFSALIEGVMLSENGPVDGSKVFAFSSFRDIAKGSPSFVSSAGEKNGFYKLDLPPGTYYLIASGQADGKGLFSYHGANPVTIDDKNLWIPFMAVSETAAIVKEALYTKLSGRVVFRGAAVKNAQVSIYPAAVSNSNSELSTPNSSFRGMGFLTSATDDNGVFSMRIEPG